MTTTPVTVYISQTPLRNFSRHRHRYHELVIEAFHYSRTDNSAENRNMPSLRKVSLHASSPSTFLFYILRGRSFPGGMTTARRHDVSSRYDWSRWKIREAKRN